MFHAAGGAVTAGLIAVTVFLVIRPLELREQELSRKAVRLTAALAVEEDVHTQHRFLVQQQVEADDKIEQILDRIPNVPRESDFLGQITTLAADVGLSIVDYHPGGTSAQDGYKKMTLTLSSDGSYESVCGFLYRIHQLPRLSRVLSLDIAPVQGKDTYRMKMTLNIFFAPESNLSVAGLERDHV